ncbi:PQQ-dependent sugar dehydrogenase [Luteimonas aestuarii]|uniref:PQQ-dependent sugar dehydrogenase n=1 Tax=Luteimonas aestuarii TaxID=453837 RepID=A0A4R5TSV4_9GAMM|nr:PQQ-dependent sugar dehydrogenase [Luteimonas aestuarii]
MSRSLTLCAAVALALLTACSGANGNASNSPREGNQPADTSVKMDSANPFAATAIAAFDEPWAMSFLPDGRLLVSEKRGALKLYDFGSGAAGDVSGVPDVLYGGQGGFGDVVPHPQFADNGMVYISYAEAGDGDTAGGAVARARLVLDESGGGTLEDVEVIWRQVPKVSGRGHYAHRILFGDDGMLWIASGDRQKFDPAQDMTSNMGKILRLNDDGSVPADNPFAGQGEVASQVWSLGHRNPLGIAFDPQGQLWNNEMGPKNGDELNRVERGENYGYPIVSNGEHYDGRPIPNHDTRPEFAAPVITWTPVISPSSMEFYTGDLFPDWRGDAFIGGLSSQALVRVSFDGNRAWESARYSMGNRIRAVRQGPDGALYLLEDGEDGRLLKLTPQG